MKLQLSYILNYTFSAKFIAGISVFLPGIFSDIKAKPLSLRFELLTIVDGPSKAGHRVNSRIVMSIYGLAQELVYQSLL